MRRQGKIQALEASTWTVRGFTLIEIAILIMLIGLLLVGGAAAVGPYVERTKLAETETKLDRIEMALRLYAARYGCLPCPTITGAAGAANVGAAVDGGGNNYTSGCSAHAACSASAASAVPWLALGLSEEEVADAWGNRITYHLSTADPVHQDNNVAAPAPCPALGVQTTYTAGVCRGLTDYPAGGDDVNDLAGGVVTSIALYVLVSHGPDRRGGIQALSGAAQPAAVATSGQAENSNGDAVFVQDDRQDLGGPTTATYFDDIVRWVSAPNFIQNCGTSACGN